MMLKVIKMMVMVPALLVQITVTPVLLLVSVQFVSVKDMSMLQVNVVTAQIIVPLVLLVLLTKM